MIIERTNMTVDKEIIDRSWQKTGGDHLFREQSLDIILNRPDRRLLFAPNDEQLIVVCVDERVYDNAETASCVNLAGSGIFVQDDAACWIRSCNPKAITYHPDCGACTMYAHKNNIADSPLIVAKTWAMELADQLGIPYYEIPEDQMTGPQGFHPARGLIIDGTGRIQAQKFPNDLPPMFINSYGAFPEQAETYLLEEIGVILEIAFGDHGYGERLTANTPFFVWIIGDRRETRVTEQTLRQRVAPILKRYGNRIRMMSTTMPDNDEYSKRRR